MKCSRRIEGPFRYSEEEDRWGEDHTCSYCGSFDPGLLMSRLEAGDVELGPTDKSYKVYLKNAGGEEFRSGMAKFYFQHLSEEQARRFVELMNEKKLKVGEPGHFYVLPYFVGRSLS